MNTLFLSKERLTELAEKYGTPLYLYNFDVIENNIKKLKKAFKKAKIDIKIYYSLKANSSLALLKFLRNKIEGLDTVSLFEIKLGYLAGFKPEEIMITSPVVTKKELDFLLRNNIRINIDSLPQINQIIKNPMLTQVLIHLPDLFFIMPTTELFFSPKRLKNIIKDTQ